MAILSIPIEQKVTLTVDEAVAYSGIGRDKLYKLLNDPQCPFVLYVGKRKFLIKRREFERYLEKTTAI